MPRRLLALAGLALTWVATAPAEGRAQGLVALQRWEDRAALVPNPGPGIEYYRLVAETAWDGRSPRDPSLYAVRVTLPGGRVETQSLPGNQGPGSRRLGILVPKDAVRNLPPSAVTITAEVIYLPTGGSAGAPLAATIDQFPTPSVRPTDRRPFGWGRPLPPNSGGAAPLPGDGPDGLHFVRIFGRGGRPGFYLAETEASNAQVRQRLGDIYDPAAGRTDDFSLAAPEQPALNLTPRAALDYLNALAAADPSGIAYRLPSREEWLAAARGGKADGSWWDGDEPPADAANFLGAEADILPGDTTAEVRPLPIEPNFRANPFGLFHTFGNVAEWATTDDPNVFARLGGHFRTDPKAESFVKDVFEATVEGEETTGAEGDPGRAFVGVRPAFDLDAEQGRAILRSLLDDDPALADVQVGFDPDRATATLTGPVLDDRSRRRADQKLRSAWFLAAVENNLTVPAQAPGQLATLGEVTGPSPRVAPLTRWTDLVGVAVRWADTLPVSGSEYWVNTFLPGGQVLSNILPEIRPEPDGRSTFPLPLDKLRVAGVPDGGPVTVALSLGGPALSQVDPRIVSNLQSIRWTPSNSIPGAQRGPETRRVLLTSPEAPEE